MSTVATESARVHNEDASGTTPRISKTAPVSWGVTYRHQYGAPLGPARMPSRRRVPSGGPSGAALEGFSGVGVGGFSPTCLDTRKYPIAALCNAAEKPRRNPFSRAWLTYSRDSRWRLAELELELGRRGLVGAQGSRKRATALQECGRCSVALSPTTGTILQSVSDGRPGMRRRTCKHRLCADCSTVRAADVAARLGPAVSSLLARPDISDGRLRMVTLTQLDERGGSLRDAVEQLWRCWKKTRELHGELYTCFASLELTYNHRRDSWHPHLHVMVVTDEYIDRTSLLATWQMVQGYEVGGALGGVDVREMDSVKEAIKYPLKGLSDTIERMPRERALEMVGWLRSKRLLRTYGALRSIVIDEDEDEGEECGDGLLVDPQTLELWAPSIKVRDEFLKKNAFDDDDTGRYGAAHRIVAPTSRVAVDDAEVSRSIAHGTAAEAALFRRQPAPLHLDDDPVAMEAMDIPLCKWTFKPLVVDVALSQLETAWAASPSRDRMRSRVLDAPGEQKK